MSLLIQNAHFVKGIDPILDAFAGTVRSDVYNLKDYAQITFVVYRGVATGGTADTVVTVNSCDDTTPSNRTAIGFRYKEITSGDTEGALTTATTTGFTTTVGNSQLYLISVDSSELSGTDKFVELTCTEATNDPTVGAILAILSSPSYASDSMPTAIV